MSLITSNCFACGELTWNEHLCNPIATCIRCALGNNIKIICNVLCILSFPLQNKIHLDQYKVSGTCSSIEDYGNYFLQVSFKYPVDSTKIYIRTWNRSFIQLLDVTSSSNMKTEKSNWRTVVEFHKIGKFHIELKFLSLTGTFVVVFNDPLATIKCPCCFHSLKKFLLKSKHTKKIYLNFPT